MTVRKNYSLEVGVVQRLEAYSREHGISVSKLISFACNQYLDACELGPSIQTFFSSLTDLTKAVLSGSVPADEATSQLELIKSADPKLEDYIARSSWADSSGKLRR